MEFDKSGVGEESHIVYPPHCSSVYTPLPRPATIPEKGMELGRVIGGHIAEDCSVHTPLTRPATIPEKGMVWQYWYTVLPGTGDNFTSVQSCGI